MFFVELNIHHRGAMSYSLEKWTFFHPHIKVRFTEIDRNA